MAAPEIAPEKTKEPIQKSKVRRALGWFLAAYGVVTNSGTIRLLDWYGDWSGRWETVATATEAVKSGILMIAPHEEWLRVALPLLAIVVGLLLVFRVDFRKQGSSMAASVPSPEPEKAVSVAPLAPDPLPVVEGTVVEAAAPTPPPWTVDDELALKARRRDETERGYSDEWGYEDREAAGIGAERDKPLGEALAFVAFRKWGCQFFDAVGEGHFKQEDSQLTHLLQLARDDKITIWGKKQFADIYNPIPSHYWEDHEIEWYSLLKGSPKTERLAASALGDDYTDLMVSRFEIEREFPKPNQG